MPDEKAIVPEKKTQKPEKALGARDSIAQFGWVIGVVLAVAGFGLMYAVEVHDWKLAQLASISGVLLLAASVATLAKIMMSSLYPATDKPARQKEGVRVTRQRENAGEVRDKLLRRLVMVAGFGLGVIFLYSVQYRYWPDGRVLSTLSAGLVSAGAAWLTGALLGFLFGIPHTKEGKPVTPAGSASEDDGRYSPSTSLEQISDWLTKIIVGLGLTQLNNIPHKLDQLAQYVAQGLGGDKQSSGFALSVVLYFSVCGFLFGYLWGRLYMLGLFREADLEKRVQELEEKLTVKDLVERQLDPNVQESDSAEIQEAIRTASEAGKREALELVRAARKSEDVTDEIKRRAIPILRALIEADKADIEHRHHSELGYILRDFGALAESLEELAKAIDIRTRRGKSGWQSYEYERAKLRVRLDVSSGPSAPEVKEKIIADIRAAATDSKTRVRIQENKEIGSWLQRNGLTLRDIGINS
jgi:hypothetical protein